MWSAGNGDDNRRFLADLRALRDTAALEFDELAARAHYPTDVLKEAESGPDLPGLPILAAYVRACDGDVPEWEERWRRLGLEADADPGLPVRPAGASPAAVAGARAGVGVAPPEAYDADRIRAVLRGSTGSPDRRGHGRGSAAAERDGHGTATAEPRVPESPARWNTETSWDETTRWDTSPSAASWDNEVGGPPDRTSWDGFRTERRAPWDSGADAPTLTGARWDSATEELASTGPRWDGAVEELASSGPRWDDASGDLGNGNHQVGEPAGGSPDAGIIETPDLAQAEAIRRDPFSAAWLQDGELTSPPHVEPEWQEAEPSHADPLAADPAAVEALAAEALAADPLAADPAAVEPNWFMPREQAWAGDETQSPATVEDTWFGPRDRTDNGPTQSERPLAPPPAIDESEPVLGFWTPSAAAQAPAEVRRPDPPQAAEDTTIARAGWPAPAETSAGDAPGAPSILPQQPPDTPSLTMTGPAVSTTPAVPPGPVVPPSQSRSDRYYPVRLLVVIVVAALIGSILVLLLR